MNTAPSYSEPHVTWEFVRTDTMPAGGVKNLPTRVLPFLWYFASQVKWQLGMICFFFGLSSLMFSFLPYGVKLVVDAITLGNSDHAIMAAMVWFLVIYGIRAGAQVAGSYLAVRSYSPFTNMMRRQLAQRVTNYSYRYFQDDFAGRIASKVLETPTAMRRFIFSVMENLVYFVILMAGICLTLSTVKLEYLGFVLVYLLAYTAILAAFIPQIQGRTRAAAQFGNITKGHYIDVIVNILQVKLFARRDHEDQVLKTNAQRQAQNWMNRDHVDWKMVAWIYVAVVSLFTVTLWYLYHDVTHDRISIGDASLILGSLIFISNNSAWISSMFSQLFQDYGEIYEGIDLITAAHEVLDDPAAPPLAITRGAVKLENLTFTYPGRPVFTNLSLTIPAGQKVGLVGPSGAGKSTLVQLMLRLYDIQGGAIKIDDQAIAHVQQESLRAQIAVIPQNADLLHRSIFDNIQYGRLDATRAEVEEAARMANAHDFIQTLADNDGNRGYAAQVGERGVKLSGGQRQRIAIARAILKNAPILLLDEATSALDSESEAAIQKSLFDVMRGRTVMAIAHRLSTIQHMDRLLVMRDGQIIEDGSHADLLARGGYYASLWARQAGGFLNL
jgi:ABC-type multidrug transport system fused ATPase/permease subunit